VKPSASIFPTFEPFYDSREGVTAVHAIGLRVPPPIVLLGGTISRQQRRGRVNDVRRLVEAARSWLATAIAVLASVQQIAPRRLPGSGRQRRG
jgi:hypothetical protein